jgi:hypothetical protein
MTIGPIAKAVETIFSWLTDEDGMAEMLKRRKLRAKKEECRQALIDNRFDDLKRLTAELERLSDQP